MDINFIIEKQEQINKIMVKYENITKIYTKRVDKGETDVL